MSDLETRIRVLEDRQAIQQLRAEYCQHLDDGRWEQLADLFTEDGLFVGLSTAQGREQMLEFFPTLNASTVTSWWHFSSNETIHLDGDRATGQTWLLQPCVVDGEAHIAAGRYEDRMQRTAEGAWLFEERRVRFFFWDRLAEGWDVASYGWEPAQAAADERSLERAEDRQSASEDQP